MFIPLIKIKAVKKVITCSLYFSISLFKSLGIVKTDIKQPKAKGIKTDKFIVPIDPITIS